MPIISMASISTAAPPDRAVREFKMSQPAAVLNAPAISNAKPCERDGNALTALMIAAPLSCILWLGIFLLLRAVWH